MWPKDRSQSVFDFLPNGYIFHPTRNNSNRAQSSCSIATVAYACSDFGFWFSHPFSHDELYELFLLCRTPPSYSCSFASGIFSLTPANAQDSDSHLQEGQSQTYLQGSLSLQNVRKKLYCKTHLIGMLQVRSN